MKKSEIMGVHQLKCGTWIAKDVKKKYLYRGKDQQEAEDTRKAYDLARGKKTRTSKNRAVIGYNKERYPNVKYIDFIPENGFFNVLNDGYWEQ